MRRRIRWRSHGLLTLVCLLIAVLWPSPASARVVDSPTVSTFQDSRLGLHDEIVYCTYCLALREPRLASEKDVVGLRLASDPTLRWKGRPIHHFGAVEVYDMRARQWVPELGSFLSLDELAFHDSRSTLWGWPRQNPIRYRDPSGRLPMDGATTDRAIGAHQDWSDPNFQSGLVTGGILGAGFDAFAIAAVEGAVALGASALARSLAQRLTPAAIGAAVNKATSCSSAGQNLDPEVEAAEIKANDLITALNKMDGNATSRALSDFFGKTGAPGDVQASGVTPDQLLIYRQVALEYLAKNPGISETARNLQLERLAMIDHALGD